MHGKLIPLALGIGASALTGPAFASDTLMLRPALRLEPAGSRPRAPTPAQQAGIALRIAESLAMRALDMPPPNPAHTALLDQARLWQSRGRDDLAAEALNKLLSMDASHPDGLAQLAFLQMRTSQKEQARQTLERLRRASANHPDIIRIDTLIKLDESGKERLRQVRMLARAGRPEEALAALRGLYPGGPPTGDLALEYWLMVADTRNGWERAHAGLRRLASEYPDNLRYRLALAEHVTVRRPSDPAALKTIIELAGRPPHDKPARAAWRRAMLRLGPSTSSIPLIERYLAHEEVEDLAVKEHLAGIRTAIERHRRLMADPYYRARLDGLALLDGGRLEDADDRLSHAVEGRPDDPEVLGGLGLLRMRQGHHAEAQSYFLAASRRDPNPSRWAGLLRTAQFWGLMREASDAVDGGEFGLAEDKLAEARAIDPREPEALLALARIHVARGRIAEAESAYRAALALAPADTGPVQGLATLYLRGGREHELENLLTKLNPAQRKTVAGALDAARAALFKEKAEALLAKGDKLQAIAMLERAEAFDRDDPWLRYDLARLYAGQGFPDKGAALFTALLSRRPEDAAARYAYALFQSGQDRRLDALTTLERVAERNRDADMTALQRRLWIEVVVQRARTLAAEGRPAAAKRLLDEAERFAGADPEAALELADARIDTGGIELAHTALVHLSEKAPSTDWRLRHARLLAIAGGDDIAAPLIDELGAMRLNEEQRAALDELRIDIALRHADGMRRAGRTAEALEALAPLRRAHPGNERLLAAEARYLRTLGMRERAHGNYRTLMSLQPQNRDAEIALIELLSEMQKQDEARHMIDARLSDTTGLTADQFADLAGVLIDLQEDEAAAQLVRTALDAAPDNARLLAHAGQLARRGGRIDEAIDFLQRSLAAAARGPAAAAPLSMLRYARSPDGSVPPVLEIVPPPANATAQDEGSGYRRLAEMLDRSTTWLSAAVDRRSRSGSAGTSEYALTEMPFEWKQPEDRNGRWTYRADLVTLRAGGLDLATAGETFGSALLCQPECNTGILTQSAKGVALNAAWQRGETRYDIGTTPLGFPVQSLIGGVLHKGDLGPFGYSVDVSRRPLAGSLLSYAGTRDPRTGQVWGGVRATGVRFGLSLDEGGRFGGWSSLGLHKLSGKNVLDNNRMQLMAGGILRIINEDDRLLQAGVTGMVWRMSENAGEYTFGHGGYYSPARYRSLSLPVTFGQRHARLSYAIRASVSASRSETSDAPYFPTNAAMQAAAEALSGDNGVTPFYSGGPGRGVGRSLSLSWEYQVDPRLFAGGRIELDRSPDYSPNRFVVYLRYAFDRKAARPVSFVPEPLEPTSQY